MSAEQNSVLRQGIPERPPLWTKDFILITLINLLLFLGFQCYPSALPPYVKSLGASDSSLGWLTATATFATLLTRPIAGLLLDRLGRRWVFLSGLVLMTAVSASMYFFPVVGIIIALRFVHGLGWGVASTAGSTVAADYIPKIRFGEGMGFFSLSASIGMAVSPAIALSLSPKVMFITATVFMAASVLLGLCLNYKKIEHKDGVKKGWQNPYEKAAMLPALASVITAVPFGATVTFLALYAAERGISNIGPFFTVYAITMMLTRPSIGRFVDRNGHNLVVPLGLVASIAAFVLLSQAASMPLFFASAVLYGLGQGSVFTSMQVLAVLNSPPHRIGAANATFFTGFDAGMGLGAVFSGVLAAAVGYDIMYLSMAVCPLLACILFMACMRAPK